MVHISHSPQVWIIWIILKGLISLISLDNFCSCEICALSVSCITYQHYQQDPRIMEISVDMYVYVFNYIHMYSIVYICVYISVH